MGNIGVVLGITGGILGILAFIGQWISALFKYINLDLQVEKDLNKANKLFARITLENNTVLRKRVDFAVLIISPEYESTSTTLHKIGEAVKAPKDFENNVNYLRAELIQPYYLKDKAIIPIPFIFSEQLYVTERTVCHCLLDTTQLAKHKYYSIKLLILEKFMFGKIRRRVVQNLMYVE